MTKKENFLDRVYEKMPGVAYSTSEDGVVTVDMENKGFTNRIAQRFFKQPAVSHIKLEGMGSFIFSSVDGRRNVYEIGQLVSEQFGDEAEPLYERLSVYVKQLEEVGFVRVVV